jgi:hypothetical protein
MKIIYIKFPRAGLCNKLLVWCNAILIGKEYENVLYFSNFFSQLRIGPFLRKEKSLKIYFRYFREKYFPYSVVYILKFIFKNSLIIVDKDDRFRLLNENNKSFILEELKKSINPSIISLINNIPHNDIVVHIRRGDFSKFDPIKYYSSDNMQICEEYFISNIKKAISMNPNYNNILIVSDDLLNLKNFKFERCFQSEYKNELLDLFCIIKSRIFIPTPKSSFSIFGAYLSNAKIIVQKNLDISFKQNEIIHSDFKF